MKDLGPHDFQIQNIKNAEKGHRENLWNYLKHHKNWPWGVWSQSETGNALFKNPTFWAKIDSFLKISINNRQKVWKGQSLSLIHLA